MSNYCRGDSLLQNSCGIHEGDISRTGQDFRWPVEVSVKQMPGKIIFNISTSCFLMMRSCQLNIDNSIKTFTEYQQKSTICNERIQFRIYVLTGSRFIDSCGEPWIDEHLHDNAQSGTYTDYEFRFVDGQLKNIKFQDYGLFDNYNQPVQEFEIELRKKTY